MTWYWRIGKEQAIPLDTLANEEVGLAQCCIIAHARKKMEAVKACCTVDELFYLTTDLCPTHRMDMLATVCQRLTAAGIETWWQGENGMEEGITSPTEASDNIS